jgi:hypothetical protein
MMRRFLPSGVLEFGISPAPEGVAVDRPMPTAAVAGAFIFGSSRILSDVPADPEIYFNGEEPSLAARLWTAGFDLFSPQVTLLYHYYLRKDGARHWNDAVSRETQILTERTLRRLRLLLEPAAFAPEEVAALGRYGLGTRRSLAEYEAFAGVSFAARSIALEARTYPFVRPPAARTALKLPDTLLPAPGTQLFVLGEDGVLFHEARGTLHRLNAAAARHWCALEAGWGWQAIAAEAAAQRGIAIDVVMAELRELAAHWAGEGFLLDSAAASPGGPRLDPARFAFRSREYRLLDSVVRLRFGSDALEALIHPAFAHLEVGSGTSTPAASLTVFRILDWYYIFAGDQPLLFADTPRKLLPKLKAEVMARAIERHEHVFHLHAAAVMVDGRLVLLPGASGSGKTVLTAQLVALGATYFSDETALLRRDGTMRPVPTALSVKAGGVDSLASAFPRLADFPEHDREDGVTVRYLPPPSATLPPPARAARPSVMVFPRHAPGRAAKLQALPAADALGRLLEECLAIPRRLKLESVAMMVEAIESTPCRELLFGEGDDAARLLMELVNGTQR